MRRAWHALAAFMLGMHGAVWDTGVATAQSWPSSPIRFIVPFPPGGTTDQIAVAPPLWGRRQCTGNAVMGGQASR
jgi:tripartite-type tricarboxylate transporter receptor subunit TctC